MHDPTKDGPEFFLCDFCRRCWSEDRPMVEGHQGALVCGPCLTIAYAELVLHHAGTRPPPGAICRLCLEERDGLHWQSPMHEDSFACLRCVKQSAGVLTKDPDAGWRKPG